MNCADLRLHRNLTYTDVPSFVRFDMFAITNEVVQQSHPDLGVLWFAGASGSGKVCSNTCGRAACRRYS